MFHKSITELPPSINSINKNLRRQYVRDIQSLIDKGELTEWNEE